MTKYLNINPVLNLDIPASINFYQLLMKFTNRFMKVLMSAVYFSTYLRPLIKHDGLIFKLKQYGISGNLLNLL